MIFEFIHGHINDGVDLQFAIPENSTWLLKSENKASNTKTIIEYLADHKIFPIV